MIVALFLAAGPACDTENPENGPEQDDTGSSSMGDDSGDHANAFFDDGEKAIILTWLGPLEGAPPIDRSNEIADDPAAAALGQKLFFDPRYSANGEVSCATCHDPAAAFGDPRGNTSEGIGFTGRASPTLLNASFGAAAEDASVWQFWDGRKDSTWSQALGPPEDNVEMGSSRARVALLIFDEYRDEYEAVIGKAMPQLRDGAGDPVAPDDARPGTESWDALSDAVKDEITEVYVNFGKAIAAYERLLVSRNSRFDAFWDELSDAPDSDVLTDEEKLGLRVFIGAGRCVGCHGGPNFTDGQFHNIAVPQIGDNIPEIDAGRAEGIVAVMADEFNCAGPWSDHPNKGQCGVEGLTAANGELGAFKTPSLRSVGQTAPYMHTGSFASLEQVVMHYDIGGAPTTEFEGIRDELMRPLGLSAPERKALVAFLRTLDGEPLDPSLLVKP